MNASPPLLDNPELNAKIFFPTPGNLKHLYWVECEGARLACSWYRPHSEGKTMVLFHGNGESAAHYEGAWQERLASLGLNSFIAEYRGYGLSSGDPSLVTCLGDVASILESLGLDPSEIVVAGRSLGSIYAIEALRLLPDIAGLFVESGIGRLLERVLIRLEPGELAADEEIVAEVDHYFNLQKSLASYRGKTLIFHAVGDTVLDVTHGTDLYEWAPEPKKIHLFPEGDHNDLLWRNEREYFALLNEFLESLS